jgi:rRNA-processing protein FCF1
MTNCRLVSLYSTLSNDVQQLRADLHELLGQSHLKKRFEDAGSGLVMITPTPFRWQPLPPEARRTQLRLRKAYARFCGLVAAVLAGEPSSTRERVLKLTERVLAAIDQDSATAFETADEAGAQALAALDSQFACVEQLPFDERLEPIIVPDTNALIYNPALETWRFEEVPRFRLAITPTTLRELDILKTRPAVRDKAERMIRQIREYRRRGQLFVGVPLRTGVSTIFAVATEPPMTSLTWLDPENEDDRLVASIIDIARDNIRVPVVLITRDANLENKADVAGIPCLPPPDPPDPSQAG